MKLGGGYGFYHGSLGEVRIWNKARSQEDIQKDMKHRLKGNEPGLVAYYPLNEGTGNTISDKTGNGSNGTIHGATWSQEDLGFLVPPAPKLEISNIFYHGEVKRSQSDEYIEIANKGGDADLAGWQVTSSGKGQDFTFPEGTVLQAGNSFRIHTNETHAEWGGFSFGSKTAIWNDKGDVGTLFDAQGKEVSTLSYGDKADTEADSVEQVKADLKVSGLTIDIAPADIEAQTTPDTKVNFFDALRKAIKSFIEDGNLRESPLWILKEMSGDFGLPANADAKTAGEKVRELLNTSGCKLVLNTDPESPDDKWAGKVMCDDTGESFGTTHYWIFKLSRSPFTDINNAVVDKSGTKPAINWGFS